ncbi:MAG TPA: acyl-CoA dehydrogenase family protein [Actinophytocola sp.]|uniref:acyl-CoA dehydrogenase family protein n=1 Tax=Actinophytocola sp. TaxID=1872138 RepID=UPI002DDCFFC1|nr:acyl-CoA dehydrogenase family protein [Actinophytocola sp.]HEV2784407.1 acyl-CoA dehydrogenase family protein [Actinophytocola sp.]
MDFSHTEAQQELAGLTRHILTDRVTEERLRDIESGADRFDRTLWTDLAEAGVLSAALPVDVGGSGYGLLERCAVLVELGRAVAPVPYLPSIVLAASAIAEFGTPRQRDRWVRPAATGDLVLTAALAEEVGDPACRAERDGDRWRVTGVKTTVPAGPIADLFLVPADTDEGTAVFLVTPRDSGVGVRRQEIVDGDDEALLELDGVELGADRVLGDARVAEWLTAHGTVGSCAAQLGVAERALELTAEYASQRVQFDRPIGTFQAVAQRLADGYIDVEAIRLTLWQAAWRLAEGLPAATEVATAKFWAADAGHRVAHTAVHIHGGVGIDKDYPLHRYFVAAKRFEFSLGGATAQLRRIGAALAAEPA